jgi:hypothetical protein
MMIVNLMIVTTRKEQEEGRKEGRKRKHRQPGS